MPTNDRVTITLPTEVVQEIDRREANRSRFVLEAIKRELARRRREELRRSLRNPHPESARLAKVGIADWAKGGLPPDDAQDLVDRSAGTPVRWVPGKGWVEAAR
jgi:post-segregation antitoxin (ccd killing protein)